jgi:hypothetical protein
MIERPARRNERPLEPEIIPPGVPLRPDSQRIYVTRLGPLGSGLLALAIGVLALAILVVMLGALLFGAFVFGLIAIGVVLGSLARGSATRSRWQRWS